MGVEEARWLPQPRMDATLMVLQAYFVLRICYDDLSSQDMQLNASQEWTQIPTGRVYSLRKTEGNDCADCFPSYSAKKVADPVWRSKSYRKDTWSFDDLSSFASVWCLNVPVFVSLDIMYDATGVSYSADGVDSITKDIRNSVKQQKNKAYSADEVDSITKDIRNPVRQQKNKAYSLDEVDSITKDIRNPVRQQKNKAYSADEVDSITKDIRNPVRQQKNKGAYSLEEQKAFPSSSYYLKESDSVTGLDHFTIDMTPPSLCSFTTLNRSCVYHIDCPLLHHLSFRTYSADEVDSITKDIRNSVKQKKNKDAYYLEMDVGPLQQSKRRQIRHISVAEPHPNVDITGPRVRKKNRTNTKSSIRSDIGAQGSFDLQTRPQAVIGAQISGAPINHHPTTQVQPHRQLPISTVTLEPSRGSVSCCARRDTARAMSSPKAHSSQSSSDLNNHSPPSVLPTRMALAQRARRAREKMERLSASTLTNMGHLSSVISSPKAHSGQSSSDLNNRSTSAVLPTRKALARVP
ncbi:hypothetical protein IFM89_022565 [Coptis chinensis]|uniref:Uncharacterized protein n=1 Tax=Coptis chinensis TaxID=261450 RepID=A0A835H510_9MAGN|nr:hypothetical protein IFM89_022565 [Coptis chinensis]